MATKPDFMEYVCDQLRDAGEITYRKMFGEYGVYCRGKFFAVVCDNQLYVKPTEAGAAVLGTPELAPPYEGAKDYFLIEDLEDRSLLRELILKTCEALPAAAPKKPKKRGQRRK